MTDKKLEKIEALLIQILAVELYKNGCTMDDVAKHLHIAKASVVKLLKGVKKPKDE